VDVVAAGVVHVPEGRRLFTGMSVRDNLLMGAYARRDGADATRGDLELVFRIFPRLAERARQDATTLSGGEQQMCAIGRGIMARPRLLMIDELSLGLAPRLVDELCEALVAINNTGVSILLVEQDVVTALELAAYGYVLDRGRITRHGPAVELLRDPAVREAYLGTVTA
jgi:branched-chain amino acid transport system ATP-binding protein